MENFDIDRYIDWDLICKDYDLKHGDITPYQLAIIEYKIKEFIKQNKQ